MKPTDKITVEITLAELAKIYAVMGFAPIETTDKLFLKAHEFFGGIVIDLKMRKKIKEIIDGGIIDYYRIEKEWLDTLFKQEAEQQRRIRELKETIAKAQQQLEQLEKN